MSAIEAPNPERSPLFDGRDFTGVARAIDAGVYVDAHVKEKIFEYIVIKESNRKSKNSILCLLGARGMGRTSIVRSLCSALSMGLIIIPVGEVKGEDGYLIGNRRSDMNATAGRIINALESTKQARTVVLLQNIDRVDTQGLGNTSVSFFAVVNQVYEYARRNNYISEPVDFSKVFFMATAANISTVPQGFREELDIVGIPSYTEDEKIRIARGYLIPRFLEDFGLADRFEISDNALRRLIREYTREAGVTELKALLGTACRRALRDMASVANKTARRINAANLSSHVGLSKYRFRPAKGSGEVGAITLLGRNDRGGCTLTLETLASDGQGRIVFTGNVDNTFQEAAYVAVDYLRSKHKEFGLEADFHKTHDLHLHIMEATTPKYGVSAGMAVVAGLVSSLTNRPVRGDVAMTGEISLHGKVLGVGDIRDKLLAACQAGIRTVFMPCDNQRDLKFIPREITRRLRIVLVEEAEKAVKQALLET